VYVVNCQWNRQRGEVVYYIYFKQWGNEESTGSYLSTWMRTLLYGVGDLIDPFVPSGTCGRTAFM
jgi:hypothetical protein